MSDKSNSKLDFDEFFNFSPPPSPGPKPVADDVTNGKRSRDELDSNENFMSAVIGTDNFLITSDQTKAMLSLSDFENTNPILEDGSVDDRRVKPKISADDAFPNSNAAVTSTSNNTTSYLCTPGDELDVLTSTKKSNNDESRNSGSGPEMFGFDDGQTTKDNYSGLSNEQTFSFHDGASNEVPLSPNSLSTFFNQVKDISATRSSSGQRLAHNFQPQNPYPDIGFLSLEDELKLIVDRFGFKIGKVEYDRNHSRLNSFNEAEDEIFKNLGFENSFTSTQGSDSNIDNDSSSSCSVTGCWRKLNLLFKISSVVDYEKVGIQPGANGFRNSLSTFDSENELFDELFSISNNSIPEHDASASNNKLLDLDITHIEDSVPDSVKESLNTQINSFKKSRPSSPRILHIFEKLDSILLAQV